MVLRIEPDFHYELLMAKSNHLSFGKLRTIKILNNMRESVTKYSINK